MLAYIPRRGDRTVSSFVLALFCSVMLIAQPAQDSTADNPYQLNFERASSHLVLSFDQSFGFRDDDQRPAMLRVYGDGMVLVHYPKYMKRAGDYRVQLSHSELLELLGVFIELDFFDFDADQVQMRKLRADQAAQQKTRQAGQTVQLNDRSNDTLTTFMIDVAGFHESGQEPQGPIRRETRWHGLKHDAKQYPALRDLVNLADLEQVLLELCSDEGLERYEP